MKRTPPQSAIALCLGVLATTPALAVDVDIAQLDWLGPEGEAMIPSSRIFQATFSFDADNPEDEQFLADFGGGWINLVVTSTDATGCCWAVQNLFVAFPDVDRLDSGEPSVQFGLPIENGIPVEFVQFSLTSSMTVLTEPQWELDAYGEVGPVGYLAGGRNGGGSALTSIPFDLGPWIGCQFPNTWPLYGSWTSQSAADLAAVEEGIDGCAPASCARSIDYLSDTNDMGADAAKDMYDDLYSDMGTISPGGTSDANMLAGKKKYTSDNGLRIDSKLVYGMHWADDVMLAIEDGADVEILISWDDDKGHAAMITSVIMFTDGTYRIAFVDDATQGDGKAKNKEHVIHVNADGSFNRNLQTGLKGGQVDGFLIEEAYAPGDANRDGQVNIEDILTVVDQWGACDGCPADLNQSGSVDIDDLLEVSANWS